VATFQRLYADVFGRDVRQLRNYCAQEPAWAASVALLDTGHARDTSNDQVCPLRFLPDLVAPLCFFLNTFLSLSLSLSVSFFAKL
jgi:hypothetical protein